MKTKLKELLLIVAMLGGSPSTALADFYDSNGDRAGNGGDAIICTDAHEKKSAELLDVFEARLKGVEIEKPPTEWTIRQNIDHVLNKLEKIDPSRVRDVYRNPARMFIFQDLLDLEMRINNTNTGGEEKYRARACRVESTSGREYSIPATKCLAIFA